MDATCPSLCVTLLLLSTCHDVIHGTAIAFPHFFCSSTLSQNLTAFFTAQQDTRHTKIKMTMAQKPLHFHCIAAYKKPFSAADSLKMNECAKRGKRERG
jgi:hypothetical protein